MDMSQHPKGATETSTKADSAEQRATNIAYFVIVAIIAGWAGITAIFGLGGFIFTAVSFVPVIFAIMVLLTLG